MFLLADSFVIDTRIKTFISVFCASKLSFKKDTQQYTPTKGRESLTHCLRSRPVGLKIMFHIDWFTNKLWNLKLTPLKCHWPSSITIIINANETSYISFKLLWTSSNFNLNLEVSSTTWKRGSMKWANTKGGKTARQKPQTHFATSFVLQRVLLQCLLTCLEQRDNNITEKCRPVALSARAATKIMKM